MFYVAGRFEASIFHLQLDLISYQKYFSSAEASAKHSESQEMILATDWELDNNTNESMLFRGKFCAKFLQ